MPPSPKELTLVEAPPKRWKKRQQLKPDVLAGLQSALADFRLTPLQLQLLVNRAIIDPHVLTGEAPTTLDMLRTQLETFLNPTGTPLPSPFAIGGIPEAVERIARALRDKEPIAVYGDYDADGVTSTVLLTQALRAFGGEVLIHVPHRKRDGYGLHKEALDALSAQGAKLVVTVDCGISNVDEVAHARAQGLDLIVTDHHRVPAQLPDAVLINPKLGERADAFADLTGVGVAHQLVRALVERLGKPAGLRNNDLLELVAIGTVADVAPLTGANRSLVLWGLSCLRGTRRPGLLALLQAASVAPASVSTYTIGYILAPRINAAGRMDDARMAYDLLLTQDASVAGRLAQALNAENTRRQEVTQRIVADARRQVAALPPEQPLIILRDPSWDIGVVGLAAARLVEEYARPALVLVDEGEVSRGSGRSTRHFDLHALLTCCEDLLDHFGGHKAAAGLTLSNANYDEFCVRMQELVESDLVEDSQLQGELQADYELPLGQISEELLAELAVLEPFGPANERPLFVARNVQVTESRANGKDGRTLCLTLAQGEMPGPTVRAVGFGMGPEWQPRLASLPRVDVMYHVELDEWQGQRRVQLKLQGVRLSKS